MQQGSVFKNYIGDGIAKKEGEGKERKLRY